MIHLISCTSKENSSDQLFKTISQNFERSNNLLNSDTKDQYQQLKKRLQDPTTAYHVPAWIGRADLLMKATNTASDSIKKLKPGYSKSTANLGKNIDDIINILKAKMSELDTTHKEYLKDKMSEIFSFCTG